MIFCGRDTARCGVRLCRVVGGYIRLSHPGGRSFGEWAILGEMCDRAIGKWAIGKWAIGLRKVDIIRTRRLKPRLDKRSPPPWTQKNYLQPTEVGFACVDAVSTAVSSQKNYLQPTEVGFACVDAVSTAVSSGCNFDGIRGDVRFQELLGN